MVFGHTRKGRTAIRRNIESGLHDCRKSGAGTCIRTHLRMSLKLLNLPTSLLYSKIIYWLPFNNRIQYKIALICFRIDSGTAPPYLSELLHIYSPSRCLRSAWDTGIFRVSRMCRRTLGERSCQYIGSVIWKYIPLSGIRLHFRLASQN